jgi:hypothetical protein
MMLEPHMLNTISHPLIDSIYLKKEFNPRIRRDAGEGVLVIRTRLDGTIEKQDREDLFLHFLADLSEIKEKVEREAGKFSRIDIKYC